jgi:hypothetical protein
MRNYLHAELRGQGNSHRVTSITETGEDTWSEEKYTLYMLIYAGEELPTESAVSPESVTDTSEDTWPSHQCH